MMEHTDATITALAALRGLGVRLAIDDLLTRAGPAGLACS